ncbi:MAG: flagellar FliJ family protein [Mariprofundus sp.]|nr:flagellar FliJ family protein [Mariprofundus sp.]
MELATSKILVQLSEQDRSQVELELGEVNQQIQQMQQRIQQADKQIRQLHQQRDQMMKQLSNAATLQDYNTSLIELQQIITSTQYNLTQMEEHKIGVLQRMKEACRTHHAYQTVHDKEQNRQQREQELHNQRQLDDLVGSRVARSGRGGI